jgi:pimeloyl-ACP methyl ester carboxylesterase
MTHPKTFKTVLFNVCFFLHLLSYGQTSLSTGEHFALINGIKIHYYVSGKGPVCLVPSPGWGPSVDLYKNSFPPFEKYFTMVYYDTRISGQSTGPDDSTKYTIRDFMDDMDSLRVYLKQSKIWIMGHSSGGSQVLYYGIHNSANLNGIIALDAWAGEDSIYMEEYTKMIMGRKGQPYFEKGANVLLRKDTTNYKPMEVMQIIFPFYFHDPTKVTDFLKLGYPKISEKAMRYTRASNFGSEYLFPELNKIKVPTLVVVGDDDIICNKVSQADRIVKNIPSSTEIVIKDAGHFPWVDQPTQFFSECITWLKKQKLKEIK